MCCVVLYVVGFFFFGGGGGGGLVLYLVHEVVHSRLSFLFSLTFIYLLPRNVILVFAVKGQSFDPICISPSTLIQWILRWT